VELVDAVGQGCGAGLENEGRFDLVDVAGSNRAKGVPAGARSDLFLSHRLATPRRNNDVRMPPHDFVRLNDAFLRELRMTKLRKNRIATRDFD